MSLVLTVLVKTAVIVLAILAFCFFCTLYFREPRRRETWLSDEDFTRAEILRRRQRRLSLEMFGILPGPKRWARELREATRAIERRAHLRRIDRQAELGARDQIQRIQSLFAE